jgi:hypothetical protein
VRIATHSAIPRAPSNAPRKKKEKIAREALQSALPLRAKTLWIPPSLMEPQGCSVIAALALAKRLFLKLKTCFRKAK